MSATTADLVRGAIAYYGQVTENYNAYAEGTFGWHYGITEPGVRTHAEALLQSNRRLIRGAGLGPGARVLDVGCGVGGFGTWVAAQTGCRVEGITVVEEHVRQAAALAVERGVDHLCSFRVMDMNALSFEPGRFDLVTNQETLMHATDRAAFLRDVWRVLAPGGGWHAVDMTVKAEPLSEQEQAQHLIACESWAMSPLVPAGAIEQIAGAVGFERFEVEDVTAQALPSARRILEYCERVAPYLSQVGEDKLARSPELRALRGHVDGGRAYSIGLERGFFRHCCYRARKPRPVG